MEAWEHRIFNGVLKAGLVGDPEEAARRLACDVEIGADRQRTTAHDLSPGLWPLSAVVERQFAAPVSINCGRRDPLPGPVSLGARCVFTDGPTQATLKLGVGLEAPSLEIWGDARGASITYGSFAPTRSM